METVIINGRRVQVPPTLTDEEIRQAGGINPRRTLIKREKNGNFVIPRGARMNAKAGDVYVDAPARIKG